MLLKSWSVLQNQVNCSSKKIVLIFNWWEQLDKQRRDNVFVYIEKVLLCEYD